MRERSDVEDIGEREGANAPARHPVAHLAAHAQAPFDIGQPLTYGATTQAGPAGDAPNRPARAMAEAIEPHILFFV
jgi:hypothetical protein